MRLGYSEHGIALFLLPLALFSACSDDGQDTDSHPPAGKDGGRDAGDDTASGDPAFENLGICGLEGEAEVTGDTFDGFEEHYLIGDEGDGPDICRIRFDVQGIGTPTVPCELCEWTFVVEKRNPVVLEDVSDGCAESELGFDAEKIAEEDGTVRAIGYVPEYAGHSNVLMLLDETAEEWRAVGLASYLESTGEFFYGRADGFCGY